jgi:Tol biopolymer transport system component
MHRRISRTAPPALLVLTLLLALVATPRDALAARSWKFGDTRYFSAGDVCRDGAVLLAGWDKAGSSLPPAAPGDTQTIPLGIRAYTSDAPVDTSTPVEDYGALLVPSKTYTMTYHVEPIVADITLNGTFIITFNVYLIEEVFWGPLLDVGDKVVVHEGGIPLEAEVEDCMLGGDFSVYLGSDEVVGPERIPFDPYLMAPERTLFTITTPPAYGTLLLNGVAIGAGSTFTAADVAAGLLVYDHTGSDITPDSFGYSMRGIQRVSVATDGTQGNGASSDPEISSDGRHIIFESTSTNLIATDTNGVSDIFVYNRRFGEQERVSVRTIYNGENIPPTIIQANGASNNPTISALGTFPSIAFDSVASNLVDNDTNGVRDVFARTGFGSITRASIRYLVADPAQPNGASSNPSLAPDGRYVAFESSATDIVASDANGVSDVFYRDFAFFPPALIDRASQTSAESASNDSSSDASISNDGDYVAFTSLATNLIAPTNDTNGIRDIFVRNDIAGTTVRVSVATNGAQATSTSIGSYEPEITPDGRFVVFYSYANNLVAGDTNNLADVFLRDRDTDEDGIFDEVGAVSTTRVSVGPGGVQANGESSYPSISADGRYIAYQSTASNLVVGDTNGVSDIFVYDRQTNTTTRVSVALDGTQANGASSNPDISYDGSYVAFESTATNLVPNDTNGVSDVFVVYTGYSTTRPVKILPLLERYVPLLSR